MLTFSKIWSMNASSGLLQCPFDTYFWVLPTSSTRWSRHIMYYCPCSSPGIRHFSKEHTHICIRTIHVYIFIHTQTHTHIPRYISIYLCKSYLYFQFYFCLTEFVTFCLWETWLLVYSLFCQICSKQNIQTKYFQSCYSIPL